MLNLIPRWGRVLTGWLILFVLALPARGTEGVAVDLTAHDPRCGVEIKLEGSRLSIDWPISEETTEKGERGRLVLDLRPGQPLFDEISLVPWRANPPGKPVRLLAGVDPVTFITVGTRVAPANRPAGMSVFNVFFDTPADRPHETFRTVLNVDRARVESHGRHARITIGSLERRSVPRRPGIDGLPRESAGPGRDGRSDPSRRHCLLLRYGTRCTPGFRNAGLGPGRLDRYRGPAPSASVRGHPWWPDAHGAPPRHCRRVRRRIDRVLPTAAPVLLRSRLYRQPSDGLVRAWLSRTR